MDLIFDGYCGICTRLVHWIRARDRHGRITAVPNQLPGVLERYGLTREQVDREVWLMAEDGRSWAGAEAIFRTLGALGAPWACLGALGRMPPFKQLSGPAYAWFARHRGFFGRWGVPPECAAPQRGCLPPSD